MALILNIDTSVNTTYVSIAKDGLMLQEYFSKDQKSNATNLHIVIQDLIANVNLKINNLNAVAVTNGPGSYTGLRIGLATAKGLCYALKIPLITIGTLEMMAKEIIAQEKLEDYLFCPMIDARRMEVFTALYDKNGKEIISPCAKVLTPQSFAEIISENKILFFGNGVQKWKNINIYNNALFNDTDKLYNSLNILSLNSFKKSNFTNLSYSEPLYVKEFYNP